MIFKKETIGENSYEVKVLQIGKARNQVKDEYFYSYRVYGYKNGLLVYDEPAHSGSLVKVVSDIEEGLAWSCATADSDEMWELLCDLGFIFVKNE